MKRIAYLLIISSLTYSLVLTGCVKQQILDRVSLYIVCGFDNEPNDNILFTIAVPKFRSKSPETVTNQLHSSVGKTVTDIRSNMELELNRPIKTGKISVVLFGKELAKKGITSELDMAIRDPQASRKMYLAVIDGSARELMQLKINSDEDKGIYLYNLINKNIKDGALPRQNLHEFDYSLTSNGRDPYLPVLKVKDNQIVISGLALFKEDKYLESVDENQMRVIALLLGKAKHGVFTTEMDDGSYVSMQSTDSKVNYLINTLQMKKHIIINVFIKGVIKDTSQLNYPSYKLNEIGDKMELELNKRGVELIQMFKEKGIDPLGLGDFVRSKTRNWSADEWKEEYRNLNIQLNVKVLLTETGVEK